MSSTSSTFYAANTPAKDCNRSNAGTLRRVPPQSQTLQPITQVFRQNAQGGAAAPDAALILSLNESVRRQLSPDVWAKYELIGSLWSGRLDDLQPSHIPASADQRGSLALANTTMETFQQAAGNCFSCHNTRAYSDRGVGLEPKNLNLSHATRQAYTLTVQFNAAMLKPPAKVLPE